MSIYIASCGSAFESEKITMIKMTFLSAMKDKDVKRVDKLLLNNHLIDNIKRGMIFMLKT